MHLYQRLNQAGFSHSLVTLTYFLMSIILLIAVILVNIIIYIYFFYLSSLIGYIIDKKFAIPFNSTK